jgi:hypothetical protein
MTFWKKLPTLRLPAGDWLLSGESPRNHLWPSILWYAGLFLLGIFVFGNFFEWGGHTLEYHDWANVTGPRFLFLRTAVKSGQLPMHISDPSTLHGWTTRYLAVADAFISPQLVLLYRLSIQRFNLANVWILYSLGFAGMLALRNRLRLSPVAFAAVFLLFNFNGDILAHYSVGHATWGGYFLFPWFVWLVMRLLDGERSWRWTFGVAALLFIIWLQGSFHQFVWLLILLALIGIFVRGTFWAVVRAGFFTFLISAFRILPVLLLYGKTSTAFINGYPSLFALWDSLVNLPQTINYPFFIQGLGQGVGSWEMTYYIGLLGGLFLLYFGVYRGLLKRNSPFSPLLVPLGIFLLLTMGQVFGLLRALPIPLLEGERISSRMFSVVLAFGLIFAAERFQRWLDEGPQPPLALSGSLLALSLMAFELWQDLNIWRISNGSKDFWVEFNDTKWFVKNNPGDTIYYALVFGGLAITVLTFIGLAFMSWRERRDKHKSIT